MMTEQQRSVFGEVLAELMHSRGIPDTPEKVTELAERAGLDPQSLMDWMRDKSYRRGGDIDNLAQELTLSNPERYALAMAYAFEEGRARDIRALIFDDIFVQLESYVAELREQGDSPHVVERIENVLMTFCEVESDLARHTEPR